MSQIRAELARRSLIRFTEFTLPGYQAADHHRQIAEALESVEQGKTKRLMIFMPPRHGKSELASRRFPAWYLGRHPDRQIIASSYNSELASDFGRDVRNTVASPEYNEVFGIGLKEDSKAANRWNTDKGGSYIAAGVGTAVTGRGAHVALIDDPFKDRQEADSETTRERVWDWYRSTLYTRLMPRGSIILIQTRWHEDDLAGRLLEDMKTGGDQWDVLELKALENGKALWPDWYPLESLEQIKRAIGPREWSALYQQSPQPDEGTFFLRDWFNNWKDLPKLKIYGTSDYAVTDGGGDYTVHRVWGVDKDSHLYRLDGWRGQTASNEWIETQLDLIAKHKPFAWFSEKGVIQKAVEPMLLKRMRERKTHCRLEWLPSIHDKPTRARGFQSRAAMGMVHMEPGADLGEFLAFPAGKHDDEVDCASLIGMALDQAHPAIVRAKEVSKNPPDLWGRKRTRTDGWKVA